MQLRRLWSLVLVVLATACGNNVVPDDVTSDRGTASESGADVRTDVSADRPIAMDVPGFDVADVPAILDARADVPDAAVNDTNPADVRTDSPDVGDTGPRCTRDMDCAGMPGFTRCDLARARCVECVATADTCATGSYCDPMTFSCTPGCRSNLDCGSGNSCCAGACVPTASDVMRCGSCTRVCGATNAAPVCTGGTCVENCTAGFGDCDRDPSTGCETATSSNPMNCGSCGRVCSFPNAASACTAGACSIVTCNAGFTNCDGMIANGCESQTATDLRNCGACGTVCAMGQSCNTGFCECPAGQVVCGGRCVNPAVDLSNCGACGNTCGATLTCTSGMCVCPAGTMLCGTRCVNTVSDVMNCGACGTVCAAGQVCFTGACTSAPPIRYTRSAGGAPFIDACAAPGHTTVLAGEDDGTSPSMLPFPLRYWATNMPAGAPITISSNGNILMNDTGFTSLSGTIPPGDDNPIVAAFWIDLVQRTGVCVATVGTAPTRQFVVEWNDAMYYSGRTGNLTFEIVFNESTNIIELRYQTMTGTDPAGSGLVGVDTTSMINGCAAGMSCVPASGTTVLFSPSP